MDSDPLQGVKMQWFFKAFANGLYPSELFTKVSGGIEYEVFEELMPLRLLWDMDEDEDEDYETTDEDEDEDEDEDLTFEGQGEEE